MARQRIGNRGFKLLKRIALREDRIGQSPSLKVAFGQLLNRKDDFSA